MDHHRAEVRHVGDGVGGSFEGHALVRAQPRVLVGELVHVHGIERREHLRRLDVDAELEGAGTHLERLAQDDEIGDAALEHRRRGAQHAVVVALGQHDPLAPGARPLDELELEHERGHHGRPGDAEGAQQLGGVDVVLEQRQCGVVPTLRVGGEAPAR